MNFANYNVLAKVEVRTSFDQYCLGKNKAGNHTFKIQNISSEGKMGYFFSQLSTTQWLKLTHY